MTITKAVKRFGELIAQGMSKIHEACELYVAVIDKYPAAKKSFKKNMPEIPALTWTTLDPLCLDFRKMDVSGWRLEWLSKRQNTITGAIRQPRNQQRKKNGKSRTNR